MGPSDAICFAAYNVCAPSCATNADCPVGATCESKRCVATPPLACDPFQSSKSCATNQTCVVQPDSKGGGSVMCAPSAGAVWPAQCASDADCAAGQACTHYGDPSHGICEPRCNTASDINTPPADIPVCPTAGPCVTESPSVTIVVPHPLSVAYASYTMGTCTVPCDPVDPGKACLSSMTCVAFNDPSGALQTDCVAPTAMGMGAGACASSPLACAPGYTCRASDKACVKWCYVGVASSCPTGQTCAAASPAVAIRAVTYGTCQ